MAGKQNAEIRPLIEARQHCAYYGVTMTGKTTLARHHAALLEAGGYEVVVYDPVGTETANGFWPESVDVIEDPDEFKDRLADLRSEDPERPIFVFVDESADIFNHRESLSRQIPRRCRHDGVFLRLIVQRPKMIHPDARTQCSVGYMFRLARDDAQMICADYGHGAEVYGQSLDQGDFLLLESGRARVSRHRLGEIVPGFVKPSERGKS